MNEKTTAPGEIESLNERVRHLKFEHVNYLEELETNLELASFVVQKVLDDFSFCEAPDYHSYLKMMEDYKTVRPERTRASTQAEKWAFGYEDVFNMVRIARDYIWQVRQDIKKEISPDEEEKK